ncbi:autotransporter-associated beta strand repeat-containing protein [Luteolibacter arcticus]|uniref:Autotransporter-associated beta strand repeat-containing protein n=1 Tax=Luteolibacter arcticus TaxID=1581411 RepID=A0ABT3GFV4_9BACT|nr:autotransporter-associated beta strand repeat-containing protein [Luteolibacter arcticus]MCW1922485.1 autotransporter-associated beta strand repeat-containing protein [Luteolibacter arcticus]
MKTQFRLPLIGRRALLLTAVALPLPLWADLTWNPAGPTNNWGTDAGSTNWLPGNVPWSQNENAIFSGTPETVTVTTANTFNDITFGAGGFTIAGGAGSFNLANDQASIITVTNAADTATIAETLADNTLGLSSLTKAGAGTLVLSGANTYTGQTLVTAGTLKLGNAAALGAGGGGAETLVSSGATLDLNNQAVTNTEIFRIAGTGAGNAGALINTGADQLNSVNRLELTADATIGGTGRFDIRPGTTPRLDLAGNTLTKIDGNQVSVVGGEITSGNIVINAGIFGIETTTSTLGGTGTITVNNGGTLGVWGNTSPNVTRPIVANAGAIIGNLGNASSIDSNITLNGPVTFSGNAVQTYLGVISGAGSINKTGTSTLALGGTLAGGANTFSGATTSTGGILALDYSGSDTSKLSDSAALTLNNSTLQMTGASGSHAELVGAVTINGASAVTVSGANLATIALGNYVTNGLLNVQLGGLATTTNANNAQGYLPRTLLGGIQFAANDGAGNIIAAPGVSYVDVTNLSSGTKSIPSAAGSIVRTIEGTGTAGNILLGAATTDIRSMLHTATTATTVDFGGQTLRLAADGELISGVGSSVATLQNGSLTAGGAADTPGNVFLANSGANAPVVVAKITNNGSGAVSLSTAGNVTLGNTTVASTNDFSGGTTVTGGTLTVATPIAAGAKSGLGAGAVTVNSGGNLRIFTASTGNAQSYANNINLNDATLTSEDGVVTYGGTITLSGTNTITAVYADKNAIFSNATNSITGAGNLVTNGTSVILSGVNTYTGTTRAASGNLQFAKQTAFYNNTPASWTATNLTVNSGATATFNVGGAGEFTSANLDAIKTLGTTTSGFLKGSNLGINTTNAGGSFTYASPIANPNGGINALGVSKRGTGTLVLSGTNTHTGTTGVVQGVLEISGSLVAGSALSTAGGTTLRITGTGSLGGGSHTSAIANAGTLQHASSSNQSFAGAISGAGAFLKDTSTTSTVSFNANHTYTGATTVNAGTLTIAGQLRGSSGFNVGTGATMTVDATNLFTLDHGTAMGNTRLFTVDGGTLLFTNTGDNRIGSVTLRNGATWTSNRTLANYDYLLANNSTGASTVKVESTGGNTTPSVMNGTGGIHLQDVQNFDVANVTGTAATDLTVSMILAGPGTIGGAAGGINKIGTGTMTLSATNSYNGATTVAVGTLLVNGSTNAASAVSVSSGATLGGTGTVNGTVNVATGGTIAPGPSAVPLATGAAIIDGTYACEINGSTSDKLTVTGSLDIDGATLNVSILAAPTVSEYIIATYTGARIGTFTGLPEGATVITGYTITYATPNQIKLVSAGPNYTSWAASFSPNPGLAGVDFENDGFQNGLEFILGGSPISGSNNPKVYSFTVDTNADLAKELVMTIAVPVGTSAFSTGAPSTASFAGFGIAVQGSETLLSYPLTVTPVTPVTTNLPALTPQGGVSYEYRSFSLGGSNGLPSKGFLRVSVTNP